jgi:hypothetical protein
MSIFYIYLDSSGSNAAIEVLYGHSSCNYSGAISKTRFVNNTSVYQKVWSFQL